MSVVMIYYFHSNCKRFINEKQTYRKIPFFAGAFWL